MRYEVKQQLSVEGLANPKKASLSRRESESKAGARVIGGDKGDLHFDGFTLDESTGVTVLDKPVFVTTLEGLTDDEVNDYANEVLQFSFDSIGIETVEHS